MATSLPDCVAHRPRFEREELLFPSRRHPSSSFLWLCSQSSCSQQLVHSIPPVRVEASRSSWDRDFTAALQTSASGMAVAPGQGTFGQSQADVLLCSRLQVPRGEVDLDIWWAKIIRLNPTVCNKRPWARKKGRKWDPSFWGDSTAKPRLPHDYKTLPLLPWMGGLISSSRDLLQSLAWP